MTQHSRQVFLYCEVCDDDVVSIVPDGAVASYETCTNCNTKQQVVGWQETRALEKKEGESTVRKA